MDECGVEESKSLTSSLDPLMELVKFVNKPDLEKLEGNHNKVSEWKYVDLDYEH